MAYLEPEFKTDIFISYARVDNETVGPDEQGWVARFVRELEVELWKRAGRRGSIEIWWDSSLDGTESFNDTIKSRISNSGLFLVLNSQGYINSEYCLKELGWFRSSAQQQGWGLKIDDRPRAVNVLLYNLPPAKWPEELQGQVGLRLHNSTRDDDEGYPLSRAERLFGERVRQVSKAVYNTLEKLRHAIETARAPNPFRSNRRLKTVKRPAMANL